MLPLAEFAAKSFVQKACASPMHPQSVLSFFFGANYFDNEHEQMMKDGTPLKTMIQLWYHQDDEYDKLCSSFSETVRAAGSNVLADDPIWNESVDGVVSQILLCDQLARNCFRGTDEAFAYGDIAETLAVKMLDEYQSEARTLPGEFYPPYLSFLFLPLIHSEEVKNHELALQILQKCIAATEDEEICKFFNYQKASILEHKEVLDKFGRYPHRNNKLGRTNTSEEQAWLDDTENLPGWAKSQ